jgi:hypothetical protein
MIDPKRCTAPLDGGLVGMLTGPLCQEAATHQTLSGRRCARHAEELRQAFRNPKTLGNVLAGGGARTEEQIARLIVELPKGESS